MGTVNPNNIQFLPYQNQANFGHFGGRYVAETLMPALQELEEQANNLLRSPTYLTELKELLTFYAGRPSPLYFAERLTQHIGGGKLYFKREELLHTGSHKINNCLGQILLAKHMGKKRIIAETGAGQHGVAVATVCARFGLKAVVFMGAKDVERQKPNVFRMKLLGADVVPVTSGAQTLKDAMNEAMRDWVANVKNTYYLIGTAAGPHPYPSIVRFLQSVIGVEARAQMLAREGQLPHSVVACVGGGSNAIGIFSGFLDDKNVQIFGVEAGGKGLGGHEHCASLSLGKPGVVHGNKSYYLQNDDGQIQEGHSISAGMDYPGVGPEHAYLKETGRVNYVSCKDHDALAAFQTCTQLEGILPALEPSHALGFALKHLKTLSADDILLLNLCGRGDKDIFTIAHHLEATL